MRCGILVWLGCMWRVRRFYRKPGVMFSRRVKFLEELRPFADLSGRRGDRIAYPDAIFWITPDDVDRAEHTASVRVEGGKNV